MNSTTRSYVSQFRIPELKAVLERLGLPCSGRKSLLITRIKAYFGEPLPPGEVCNVPRVTEPWRLQAAERVVLEVYCNWKKEPVPPLPWPPGAAQLGAAAPAPAQQPAARAPAQQQASHAPAQQPAAQPAQQMAPNGAVEIIPAGGSGAQPRSGGRGSSVNGRLVPSGSRADASSGRRVRCVCEPPAAHADTGSMVQCQAEGCGVWQHAECLGRSPQQQQQQQAQPHFCELCRASWADPFWATASRLLPPARLSLTGGLGLRGPGGVVETQQAVDKTFQLPHSVLDLARRREQYQLQVQCLMLDDPVPFRFQWPRNADLRVNGIAFRLYSRNPGSKISNNTRDEPADLASAAFAGRNRIRLQVSDSRKFVVLVQLMQRRSEAQVRGLMAPAETLEAALARVRQQLGPSDGDDDLAVGTSVVSLRDPLSGVRIAQPAHFTPQTGLVAFDVASFLSMAARSRKWQCPNSMRHGRVQDMRQDGYLTEVLQRLEAHPDVTEIEVSAEGRWRPAGGGFPWLDATQELPPRAPEEGAVAVKPEPEGSGSASEELSEGEELRRAAAAYARNSKRQAQEVIVLEDSSDDEAPPPPAKRAATGAGVGQAQPAQNGHAPTTLPGASAAPAGIQVRLPSRLEQLQQSSLRQQQQANAMLQQATQRLQQTMQQTMQRVSSAGPAASQAEGPGARVPGAAPSAFVSRQPSAGSPHPPAPAQPPCFRPTSPAHNPTSSPPYSRPPALDPTSAAYNPLSRRYTVTSPPYPSASALAAPAAAPRSAPSPAPPPLAFAPFSPPQPAPGGSSAPARQAAPFSQGWQAAVASAEPPRSASAHPMPRLGSGPAGRPGAGASGSDVQGSWLAGLMAGVEPAQALAQQQAAPGSSQPGAAPGQEAAGTNEWLRVRLLLQQQHQQRRQQQAQQPPQQQPQAAQQGQQGAFTSFDAAVLSALLADDAVSPAPRLGGAAGSRPLANGGGGVIDLDSD